MIKEVLLKTGVPFKINKYEVAPGSKQTEGVQGSTTLVALESWAADLGPQEVEPPFWRMEMRSSLIAPAIPVCPVLSHLYDWYVL
jgi:hypothetical protein